MVRYDREMLNLKKSFSDKQTIRVKTWTHLHIPICVECKYLRIATLHRVGVSHRSIKALKEKTEMETINKMKEDEKGSSVTFTGTRS